MEITLTFLYAFLKKEKTERTIFEFSSAKKIDKAIARFSHRADEILDPAKVMRSGENISEKEVLNFFRFTSKRQSMVLFVEGQNVAFFRDNDGNRKMF